MKCPPKNTETFCEDIDHLHKMETNQSPELPAKSSMKTNRFHSSIFTNPESVEPERVKRAKNRARMTREFRDSIRDLYHQTDYLIDWTQQNNTFVNPDRNRVVMAKRKILAANNSNPSTSYTTAPDTKLTDERVCEVSG